MRNIIAISKAAANSYHDSKVLGKTLALGSAPCFALNNLLCVCAVAYMLPLLPTAREKSPIRAYNTLMSITLKLCNRDHPTAFTVSQSTRKTAL